MILAILTWSLSAELVSFETLARRMPLVLEAFSQKTGRRIEADGAFQNEVLVLSVSKQPVQAVLDRIAEVSSGRWESVGEKLVLRPDAEKRKKQTEARMRKRIDAVQVMLDRLEKELREPYTRDTLTVAATALQDRQNPDANAAAFRKSPKSRLLARTLIALGASRLASIEAGERIVVSTSPTKMQIGIPDPDKNLALYRAEEKLLEETMPVLPPGTRFELNSGGSPRRAPFGTVEKFESMTFSIPDLTGFTQIVDMTVTTNLYQKRMFTNMGVAVGFRKDFPSSEPLEPLNPNPMTVDLAKALAEVVQFGHPTIEPKSPLGAYLSDPAKNEPLSIGSELYIEFAKKKSLNLAVLLNDGAFGRFGAQPVTMRSFDVVAHRSMDWAERDGWLMLTSSTPVEARQQRDDRKAIASLLKSPYNLESRAKYILPRPFGAANGLGARILCLFQSQVMPTDFSVAEDQQRLYAALTDGQRKSKAMSIRGLSPIGRKILQRLVYGTSGLFLEGGDSSPGDTTEILGDGIDGSTLQIDEGREPKVRLAYTAEGKQGYTSDLPVNSAALEVFWEKNPQFVRNAPKVLPQRLYVPTESHHVRFSIPGQKLTWWTECAMSEGFGALSLPEDLPPAHRAALEEELGKLQKLAESGQAPIKTYSSSGGG